MTHHMYASVYPGKSAIYVSLVRASNLDIAGPEDITGLLAVVTSGREISSREYCIVRLSGYRPLLVPVLGKVWSQAMYVCHG